MASMLLYQHSLSPLHYTNLSSFDTTTCDTVVATPSLDCLIDLKWFQDDPNCSSPEEIPNSPGSFPLQRMGGQWNFPYGDPFGPPISCSATVWAEPRPVASASVLSQNLVPVSHLEEGTLPNLEFVPPRCPPRPWKEPPQKARTKDQTTKRFQCLAFRCHMAFDKQNALKQHMLTHTGERPHECDICRRRFSLKCNLERHKRTGTCTLKRLKKSRAVKQPSSSSSLSPSLPASSPSDTYHDIRYVHFTNLVNLDSTW